MFKRIIPMILVFSIILSSMISVFAESSFLDMPKSDYWSFKALNEAINNGLIHGYNGKINPKNNVTRAQLAAVINNAFGAKEIADISMYKDVPSNAWYAKEMGKAFNMGTIKGNTSNKLDPLSYATRQETFCVIANALKLSGADVQNLNKFSDKDRIASWATDSLASLVQAGYISGYGGKLNPTGKITLEELTQVMSNIIQQYFSVSGEYTEVAPGNVMINTENVTLKNTKISGDLIIGEGAGNSDITLDKVNIGGRLVVRGGGQNSIKIINNSNVGSVIVGKSSSGAVRIKTEEGCKIDVVYIDDGKDDVIVEGVYNQVVVKSKTPVIVKDADVNVVSVVANSASVKIEGKSTVQTTEIQENAKDSQIEVTKDATVKKVNSTADNVVIGGEGKVVEANISGDNTQVNTDNTDLVVEKGTTGVIENGNSVKDTGIPIKTGEPTPVTPPSGSGGTGGTGGTGSEQESDTIEVASEAQLINAINSNTIKNVKISENIVLTNNLSINKYVEIAAGKELTIGAGKNLTVDRRDQVGDNPENTNFVPGYWGLLYVCGTLNIPKDSTFYNYANTVVDGGKIKCYGNYVDISGVQGLKSTKNGFLELQNSTLYNEGTFVISSGINAYHSNIQHCGGRFTNNSGLVVIGGSITASSEFHNAGYMKVVDEYSSADSICNINFGNNITDDSKWIEYTASVYNEDALKRVVKKQNEKVEILGDNEAINRKFQIYNRIDICENMIVNSDVTINKADVWVVEKHEKEVEQVVKVELTNNATISLNNCTLHIDGKLINNNKIILGQTFKDGKPSIYGGIQVWPRGKFTNNGNVDVKEGRIYRMDDLKPTDTGLNVVKATIDGTNSLNIYDTAIVHNFEGIKKAAVTDKAIYERIEIMRYDEANESDITLEADLDIDADMYIEWGCGIEVPENYTLSFVGNNHNIDNNGDMWIYGKLNLGSNYGLYNNGKIQVGGITGDLTNKCTFTNNGFIENRNYIEVLSNGLFTNNGTINNQNTIKVQDGEFNGNGIVYADTNSNIQGITGKIFTRVYDYEQLKSALGNSSVTNIVITGNVDLKDNLSVDKSISIGYDREWGELKTNGYTITIPTNQTLSVNAGRLVINKNFENSGLNGKIVNNGTLTTTENGGIRIEEGGALETANDIDILGWLDVYNYEGMNSYITGAGKIITYSDRAGFIDRTSDILYEFNDQENSIIPSDIAVNASANITPTADIELKVPEVRDWFIGDGRDDNYTRRHYAYASMMLNGIGVTSVSDLDTPENNPYTKVTYGYAKAIFEQVANRLGLGAEQSVVDFMSTLDSKDSTACIDNFGQDSSIDKLINDFSTALCQATGKMIVWEYSQLMSAINDNYITDIMISGNIELNDNLSVDKSISIGSYRNGGELKTNGYTITISTGNTLNINEGNLLINKNNVSGLNGNVVNNGTITVAENGCLRIEQGGTLETASDIDIRGHLDVYDYEGMSNYITGTGKITTYSDRACFIDRTLDILYEFNDQEVSVTPSAISVSAGASITPTADIVLKVPEVRDWFIGDGKNDDNTRRHYAYSAMMLNGIGVTGISDLNTPENRPYTKVTYGYAKAILEQVANKLGLGNEQSIVDFMNMLDSKDSTAYIDDFGQFNSINKLFDDFYTALNQAI